MMDAQRRRALFIVAGLAAAAGGAGASLAAAPKERVIKVKARRFTYAPDKITVKKGEPIVFELTTADILMGFSLPDFGVRADIVPDKVTRLALTPDKTGTFQFLCDIFCGEGHESMNGTLVVV